MLLVTAGDPQGIGPEVVLRALATRREAGRDVSAVVVGDFRAMRRAGALVGAEVVRVSALEASDEAIAVFDPGDDDEPVEVASVRRAVEACLAGNAAGLVTAPIHKGALAKRGFAYRGHTDFLGHLCGVERPVMAFVGGELMVALVTVHVPLRDVADLLDVSSVLHTIRTADEALRERLGLEAPRLVVCGLNPHAGEGGLLGHEELVVIGPAVRAAAELGVQVTGPVSAEAAFRAAAAGEADLVVAMYHDQGLAPLKLVDFGRSVNWTLGLPILRTSVDHGTAYDIAWQGVADPASMLSAIELAERLS